MCINKVDRFPSPNLQDYKRRQRLNKPKVLVLGLTRKRGEDKDEKDMKLKNLKLYLENKTIVEENEKLRKQASLLHQENLALMSELQKKFPLLNRFPLTTLLST